MKKMACSKVVGRYGGRKGVDHVRPCDRDKRF